MASPRVAFGRLRPSLAFLVLPLLVACNSPLDVEACPMDSQWGTTGCAVVHITLLEPDVDPVGSYSLLVSAALDGGGYLAHAPEPRFGRFSMTIDLGPFPTVEVGPLVDVWVIARLVSTGAGSGTGSNTTYLAQDSVRTSIRFVPGRALPTPGIVVLRPE